MNLGGALLSFLIFPGLLYGAAAGWLMLWVERKLRARMQGRIGPPFYQPFFDFVKLMAKDPVRRSPLEALLMTGLPMLSAGALLVALALLPVFPASGGFAGDLVLLVALLEVPALCGVLAGFASRSIFGQVGASREAVLSVVSNIPFLTAMVALASAAKSIRLADIVLVPSGGVRVLALAAVFLCLPVKLRLNPFSLVNAEQEIYAGPLTEYSGPRLALWEFAHALEWAALTGLAACLATPSRTGRALVDVILFAAFSLLLAVILTVLAAGTARLKVAQAGRFYWRWGMAISVLALLLAVWPR
ncbi:MAG: complex I subunit 1 family protein [Acidobacteriota bacterium]